MENLGAMIDRVDSTSGESKLEGHFIVTLFRELRKSKLRRPDIVLRHADQAIAHASSNNEKLSIYEQIVLAALDLNNESTAESYLDRLVALFPTSDRVSRVIAMSCEQQGDFADALSIYNSILESNPTNLLVRKRKVAIRKAQQMTKEAIEELLDILRYFPGDPETWLELTDIYVKNGDYKSAAHCCEDLVLIEPQNAHFHTKLADVYYMVGEYDFVLLARKHYTMSLTMLSPGVNLRALYGLIYACKSIANDTLSANIAKRDHVGSNGVSDASVNAELLLWAKEQLSEVADKYPGNKILKTAGVAF